MENFWYIVVFSFVLSLIFFGFYSYNRRQDDEGTATSHLVIAIILSVITVVLFLIMVNVNHLYEDEKEEEPMNIERHHKYLTGSFNNADKSSALL